MKENYNQSKTRSRFLVLMLLFCGLFANTIWAQTFNFTNSTDNFTPTGSSAVTLNPTSITYTITSGRTNFYIDQKTVANGGIAINTANYNYVKVVLKNNSQLGFLTLRNSSSQLCGTVATAITKGDTEFKTYYYALNNATYWTGAALEGIRVFLGTGTTLATDTVEIDKVEFISFTPASTTNGFIKNPGFEDVLGSSTPWKTSSTPYVKSVLDYANARTGQASMKFEYLSTSDVAANLFIFSDDTMGVAPGTAGTTYSAGTVIEVKCWIKTSAGTPAFNMLMRFPLRDGVSTTPLANVDGIGAVPAGDGNWNQITFSYTTTVSDPNFKTIGIWPGILSTEGLGGLNTTHAVYLDDFTSTFTPSTMWTGTTDSNWSTATNWSAGVPTSSYSVLIPDVTNDPIINTDVALKSLIIDSGAVLTVSEGKTLTSSSIANAGELKLKSSATGTASLKSDASVDNVTQERYLASNQRGWRLLSNPLSAKTFNTLASDSGITLGTNYTGEYLSASNTWTSTDGSASMATQQAYKVFITGLTGEAPAYTTGPSNVTLVNKGTAANTVPSAINTVINHYYLIANPYTAPVSLANIIAASTGLSNTVSYYDPTNAAADVKLKAGGYDFVTVSGVAGSATDVVLPPMGAVFVQASSAGTINIPKSVIYTGAVAGDSYNQKTAQNKVVSPAALNLEVASNGVNYDKVQLRFKEVGTAGTNVDFGKLPNSILDFYSIENSANKAVSELELKEQIIPIGINSTLQSSFTLNVAENTIPVGYVAELVDNVLNTTTVLTAGTSYNFDITSTSTSQGNARFAINLKTSGSLSVQANELDTKIQVYPNPAHGQFNILNAQGQNNGTSTIEIYSLNGQVIHSQKSNPGTSTTIQTNGWAAGVYLLKATNNGTQTTKKLIIQ